MVRHRLTIHPSARQVAQKKQKVGEEKRVAIDEEVGKLFDVGFIMETKIAHLVSQHGYGTKN